MRIVGIISTARRNTSPKVANWISPICDSVFILAKQCEIPKGDYTVIRRDNTQWESLAASRNLGAEIAIKNDYDYMLVADDDIRPTTAVLEKLVEIAEDDKRLGVVCSPSTVLYHWSEETTVSKPYLMVPDISQLALIRVSALKQLDPIYIQDSDEMLDRILCLRLWSMGIPSIRVHLKGYEHNILISKSSRNTGMDIGGLRLERSKILLPLAINYVQQNLVGGVVKSAKYGERNGIPKFYFKYNYAEMCKRSIERNGVIGYTDSKGRQF